MGDSSRLVQLMGTAVGRSAMAVGVKYHGGLGGMGIENGMMIGVKIEECPRGYVGLVLGLVLVRRKRAKVRVCEEYFEILNTGVVGVSQNK